MSASSNENRNTRRAFPRRRWLCVAGVLLYGASTIVKAYEVETHRRLTLAAFERSILADSTRGPLAGLGVSDLDERRFNSIPPDDLQSTVESARGLVGLGAIYEDHPDPRSWPPPPPSQWRFLRHFYDPQQNGKGLGVAWSSRQWVLEADGDIAEQEFSLHHAREFYMEALTRQDAQSREQQLVLLLQSMGRAVHHLQDMTQPAHVRDDPHPPYPIEDDPYESYTETQFVQNRRPLPAAACGEAPIDLHQFDTAAKFWSNAGKGVAEFTSNNFVSQDTNFPRTGNASSSHPLPPFPAAPVYETTTLGALGISGLWSHVPIRFLGLPVSDAISGGGCLNPRAATLSFLSHDLQLPSFPHWQLNIFNFEENYRILFPRAINYSAGLIDYFFRGRLELVSYALVGNDVQIVVRNASAAQFAFADGSEAGTEEFSLYYEAQNGERRRWPLANDDLNGATLAHGDMLTLSFPMPADVAGTDNPFLLVFNGTIGTEAGIASLPIGHSEGSFIVTPNYLPADAVAGTRMIYQEQGAWRLNQQSGGVAGNIDWRGHDPSEVLTWEGPEGRYFGELGESPKIYSGGKVLSIAPGPVLGAAITGGAGPRYLIAAVAGAGIAIYRRPYQNSYRRDGLYDPLNNPLGWKLLYTHWRSATSPMFFNASGTQGQVFTGSTKRVKMTIAGESVTAVVLDNTGSYKQTTESTYTKSGSAEVNPGPPNECRGQGFRCVGAGTCTDDNGTTYEDICVVEQLDEDISSNSSQVIRTVTENVVSAVVCADYVGNTEVLCLIEVDETPQLYESRNNGHYTAVHVSTTNASCGLEDSGPARLTYVRDVDYSDSSVMTLRVGSRSIPLWGTLNRVIRQAHSHADWDNPGSWDGPLLVDYVIDDETTTYDSKVLYVDARNDILVYEEHTRVERTLGDGTTNGVDNPAASIYYSYSSNFVRNTRTTSRTIVLANQEFVVSERTTQEPPIASMFGGEPTDVEIRMRLSDCTNRPPNTSTYSTNFTSDPALFFVNAEHSKLYEHGQQGVSAIAPGMFVASIPIWIRQENGSYVREGTWNHLSGGSLPALLPVASADASYAPIGIVK